jgi:hypothetical protein
MYGTARSPSFGAKRRDDRRDRVGSGDILPEIPSLEDTLGLDSPLAIVVAFLSLIFKAWEFTS